MYDIKFLSLFILLITFGLILSASGCSSSNKTIDYSIPTSPSTSIDSLQVFTTDQVDQKPKPKDGYRDILYKVQYPEEARKVGAKGKVIVKFVVTETGESISHYIDSSPHPALSQEALRVIEDATFEPGMKNGQAVNTWLSLPISFNL